MKPRSRTVDQREVRIVTPSQLWRPAWPAAPKQRANPVLPGTYLARPVLTISWSSTTTIRRPVSPSKMGLNWEPLLAM